MMSPIASKAQAGRQRRLRPSRAMMSRCRPSGLRSRVHARARSQQAWCLLENQDVCLQGGAEFLVVRCILAKQANLGGPATASLAGAVKR